MPRPPPAAVLVRRRLPWLLALGLLLALAQSLALTRSLPQQGAQVAIQLCTAHGLVSKTVPRLPGQPAPSGQSHDCCLICVLGTPTPPLADLGAVSPAPTFGTFSRPPSFAAPITVGYARPPARAPPAA